MNSDAHDLVHKIREAGTEPRKEDLESLGFEPLFGGKYMGLRLGVHDLVYQRVSESNYALMSGEDGREIARGHRAVSGAGRQ